MASCAPATILINNVTVSLALTQLSVQIARGHHNALSCTLQRISATDLAWEEHAWGALRKYHFNIEEDRVNFLNCNHCNEHAPALRL